MFEEIRKSNPNLRIAHVTDPVFKEYGRVIESIDCTELMKELVKRPLPDSGNIYVASDEELEKLPVAEALQNEVFGGLPIEIGYCNGNSYQLNALEYHKCPEVNIATEDIILFLGKTSKITDETYRAEDVQPFFIPKGVLIELDGTTMHFAPCKTSEKGFRTIVVLPKGTNQDLTEEQLSSVQSKTLFKLNKWLLAHPENERMINQGAYVGLFGENLQINQPVVV